jgi:hypothetical protein
MLLLVPAFLKANYHTVLELLLVAALLGVAALALVAAALFRLRWAGLVAAVFSLASGLPILMLFHGNRFHKVAVGLGLVALLVGAFGAWFGMGSVARPAPPDRIRLRKRKSRK